jgi:hypothetical protein
MRFEAAASRPKLYTHLSCRPVASSGSPAQ